jgi:transcriptional regulator with XRE-family HTH domain
MGARALSAREAAGLAQSAVAGRLGIARQTLASMEQGKVPFDGVQLVTMADLYGRPVTYFYDLRETEGLALAFRADDPRAVDLALKQRLLDRLAAIADLEIAAGARRIVAGASHPPNPCRRPGRASYRSRGPWPKRSAGAWGSAIAPR